MNKHKSKPNHPNLTQRQSRALSELVKMKRNRQLRISVSDKGGEFVVMNSNLDNQLMEKHLGNESLYERTTDLTQQAENEINEVWEYVAKKNQMKERTIARLKTFHSQCPVIYLLTKTHKFPHNIKTSDPDVIKVRPIISGCGGPADKISWLIQVICNPLLKFVKAHLRNTEQLLRNFRSTKNEELKNKFLFSLDVVSLYPSVDNDAAIDTLRICLEKEKKNLPLCFFPVSDLLLLIKSIFRNSCFSWKRRYYRQLRGLAMGNRLAPILAILFLDRIENQAIYADLSISLFYPYFDDCIAPASSYEEAYKIQNHLNCQEPSICYEIELPGEDGFLPFLNTKVRVNDSGIVETGWYTKPANKGLMLNAKSHHPEHIKHAVINNTINTYTSICSTNTLLQEATDSFKTRAQRNGYSPQYINQVTSKPKKLPRHHREPLPTLTIPYISSAFTNDIKKALKRYNLDIRLVQRPQSSLKNLLVESRPYDKTCEETAKCNVCRNSPSTPKTHCSQKDIVYSIECDLCHDDDGIYIGETSRPLALRFQEHYRSAANPNAKSYKNMTFSKHYKA